MIGMTLTFDTLSSARRLREKGLPQEQAEAIADELRAASQLDVDHLSTKEEMKAFKSELKADLRELDSSLRGVIREVDVSLRGEIALVRSEARETELRLTVRLGGMIMALGGILIAIKYFG